MGFSGCINNTPEIIQTRVISRLGNNYCTINNTLQHHHLHTFIQIYYSENSCGTFYVLMLSNQLSCWYANSYRLLESLCLKFDQDNVDNKIIPKYDIVAQDRADI